jgi:beta-aspartyl-peptidase (threonine type)
MKFTLLVHGGAWDIPAEMHQDHLHGLENAAQIGMKLLTEGKNAIHTVIEVVKQLERDPTFDAEYGSILNLEVEVEMDAIVMDGKDLSAGAVAAIQNVAHPVEVAELIRTHTEHILLAGNGASIFAHQNGITFYPAEKLLVGRELERYKALKKKKNLKRKMFFEDHRGRDTVGAVIRDKDGNLAAATSTGGTPNKIPGRVGDSPIIGAGAYADNQSGAASSTGYGESIMQVLLAKSVIDFVNNGNTANEAAERAIKNLGSRVDGRGGVICIDRKGRYGYAYNTPYMARAVVTEQGIQHLGI